MSYLIKNISEPKSGPNFILFCYLFYLMENYVDSIYAPFFFNYRKNIFIEYDYKKQFITKYEVALPLAVYTMMGAKWIHLRSFLWCSIF